MAHTLNGLCILNETPNEANILPTTAQFLTFSYLLKLNKFPWRQVLELDAAEVPSAFMKFVSDYVNG